MEAWNNLDNYHFQEKAIDKLFFELCPNNIVRSDILLKVLTLNVFYSTNIFSPYSVAKGAVKEMNSQQKTISKTEEDELFEVHKLLKKYGVSYQSIGCFTQCYYVLKFNFKTMKWKFEYGNGSYSEHKSSYYDDYYNRAELSAHGSIPAYVADKFARKIFFVKDFTGPTDLCRYNINCDICDASGSEAAVLGKEFSWIPAAIGGFGDVTSCAYSTFLNKNFDIKEYLSEQIKVDFFNQIARAIFDMFNDCLLYADYTSKKLYPPSQDNNFVIPIVKDYIENYIFEIEQDASNRKADAINYLAILYENGVFYPADKEKAISLHIQAARWGNISAIQHVVELYKTGEIKLPIGTLTPEEIKIWQVYVEIRDDAKNSEYILGLWYELQSGNDNIYAALQWYHASECSEAHYKLGTWYLLGKNVEQDFEKSSENFCDCTTDKCLDAIKLISENNMDITDQNVQLLLGRLYASVAKSYTYEKDNKDSYEEELKKEHTSKAIDWLEKAASQNNTKAMLELYSLYTNDFINRKSERIGIQWLRKAANLNNIEAILRLAKNYAFNYFKAISKKNSFKKAKYWFSKLPYSIQYENPNLSEKIYHQKMLYSVINTVAKNINSVSSSSFLRIIYVLEHHLIEYNGRISIKTLSFLKEIVQQAVVNEKGLKDYIEVLCEQYSTNTLEALNKDLKLLFEKKMKDQNFKNQLNDYFSLHG